MRRNRNDRDRYGSPAEELVKKLEELADVAMAQANELARDHGDDPVDAPDYLANLRRLTELVERETNYRHAAELARNLLEVTP